MSVRDSRKPLVSIIILNWNGEKHLAECLRSVLNTTYKPTEVIVVDNASSDNSLEVLSFFSVKVVRNEKNVGYAAGNNIGFQHAKGKYVVTLNNDLKVAPTWLDLPVKRFEEDPQLGIVSCRQMEYSNPEIIDTLYITASDFLLPSPAGFGKVFDHFPEYNRERYVFGANGASAVYRREMLDRIGLFDERFFAYHEESDLCMRAFLNDWKCLYIPSSVIFHKGSASFVKKSRTFFYYHERNRIWYIWKHFPIETVLHYLVFVLYWESRIMLKLLLKFRMFDVYLKARFDSVLGLKNFISDRSKHVRLFRKKKHEYIKLMKRRSFGKL